MNILLDTCTFLWMIGHAENLSEFARRQIADPANDVFLSAASAWEVSVKHSLGRLPLPDDPIRFVSAERERHRITALPIDETAALNVERLPALHRDPFDRMLVSQAMLGGFTILTPDRLITQYPAAAAW